MSLALIQESAKEVRRLAIAGSTLAVGDFRLKKLAAPLEQAGAKVPVFAQVAKAIGDLVEGDEARSAERLLTLSTLLNAILYTQGQTGLDGTVEELATTPVTGSVTRTPARVLRPLQEALTRTGGGRFEVVKSAVDADAFHDLRLVDPAIQALGDAYPELADLVAEKVLPSFGPGIASRLKDGLDLKGKKQDARRLEVLHRVDPATALPLCKAALEEGAPDVKAAAIACLGEHEDCLPLMLEQAKAKNKQVKAAALEVLAKHDRPEVETLFVELLQGKALDLLAQPLRTLKSRKVLEAFLAEGTRLFDLLRQGDTDLLVRFWGILDGLEARRDSEVEAFLLNCFNQTATISLLKPAKNSHLGVEDLVIRLAALLQRLGTKPALEAILARWRSLPPSGFSIVLGCAARAWTPEAVFEEFSPLLNSKKGSHERLGDQLVRFITLTRRLHTVGSEEDAGAGELEASEANGLRQTKWDARWLDAAIQAGQQELVCALARPGHQDTLAYLLKLAEAKVVPDAGSLIVALSRCGYPETASVYLTLAGKRMQNSKHFDYELRCLFDAARHLPAADLPKLEAFAATLDEKFMEPFLEALAPLRSSAPTA